MKQLFWKMDEQLQDIVQSRRFEKMRIEACLLCLFNIGRLAITGQRNKVGSTCRLIVP